MNNQDVIATDPPATASDLANAKAQAAPIPPAPGADTRSVRPMSANKLAIKLAVDPEMTPLEVVRIEVAKVADPVLRAGIEVVVDAMELGATASLCHPWNDQPLPKAGLYPRNGDRKLASEVVAEQRLGVEPDPFAPSKMKTAQDANPSTAKVSADGGAFADPGQIDAGTKTKSVAPKGK